MGMKENVFPLSVRIAEAVRYLQEEPGRFPLDAGGRTAASGRGFHAGGRFQSRRGPCAAGGLYPGDGNPAVCQSGSVFPSGRHAPGFWRHGRRRGLPGDKKGT